MKIQQTSGTNTSFKSVTVALRPDVPLGVQNTVRNAAKLLEGRKGFPDLCIISDSISVGSVLGREDGLNPFEFSRIPTGDVVVYAIRPHKDNCFTRIAEIFGLYRVKEVVQPTIEAIVEAAEKVAKIVQGKT